MGTLALRQLTSNAVEWACTLVCNLQVVCTQCVRISALKNCIERGYLANSIKNRSPPSEKLISEVTPRSLSSDPEYCLQPEERNPLRRESSTSFSPLYIWPPHPEHPGFRWGHIYATDWGLDARLTLNKYYRAVSGNVNGTELDQNRVRWRVLVATETNCSKTAELCFYARSQDCEKILLPSSCPSFRQSAWRNVATSGRILMKFDIWVSFENLSRKLKFH
jgi:hypothetical protein